MRTPEEVLKEGNEGYDIRTVIDNLTSDQIIDCMEQYAQEVVNNLGPVPGVRKVMYVVSAKDLRESFLDIIRREVRFEFMAVFNQKIISVEAVAQLHRVDAQTVRKYAQSGDIICEPRVEGGSFYFRLGDILEVDFKELKKQFKLQKRQRK